MSFRRVFAVLERDLRRISRNPFALVSAVVLPLVYLLILGNSLQGPLKGLRLGVVMMDDGAQARTVMGALQSVEEGPGTVVVVPLRDPEDGSERLRRGELSAFLVIPPGFSRDLSRGVASSAGLFLDNVDAVSSMTLQATVQGALAAARSPLARFERHLGGPELRAEEVYPRVDYDTSLLPGVVVMSIFLGAMMTGAFNVVMDRFLGVHESYLSTPLRRMEINFGVLASGTIVTLASSASVLLVGALFTGARVHGGAGGYLALAGVMVLTALGLLAMLMAILGRANHPRISGTVSGFLQVLLFFPSGALYPISSFPPWLRAFAQVNPETHAVAALKAILFRGGDVGAASFHVAWLAVFTAAMLVLSTALTKRTL